MDLNPEDLPEDLPDDEFDARRDLILDMCYDAIFDGLPVMRLRAYQHWDWDHETHRIRSLQDFRDNFGTVMQIFRDNNLADEYARRFVEEPGHYEGWPGPLARHSTPEIERLFHGLLRWINREGVDGVRARIEQLFVATHQNAAALYRALRALMYNPACTACTRRHTAHPDTAPRRRDADLSHLMHRMHSLHSDA